MSFFEDLIFGFVQELLYDNFKLIGIAFKWCFSLGKKSITEIKSENWNTRIGFLIFIIIMGLIIYAVN